MGHCNRLEGNVYMPFRNVLYMRLIPTIPLKRPVAEQAMLSNAFKYGAMGSAGPKIPIVNSYGAMCFAPAGNTNDIDVLTQYFPNGEVWALNADIMRQGERGNEQWYIVLAAEDAFIETLKNGLDYLKNVARAELPIKVIAGVVGMKGRTVAVTGGVMGAYGKMMNNEAEHTMVFHDDSLDAQDQYLFQLFEKIFDQSGHPRPKHLNAFLKKS
jgi:hypothetical protein